MSAWKVVGLERSWEGDPRAPAKAYRKKRAATLMNKSGTLVQWFQGTGRPDEVTYRLRLEKWGPIYDLGEVIEQDALHDVSTANVTVRYVDGEDGVTATPMTWEAQLPSIAADPPMERAILDYLRNHQPTLLWSTP